MERDGQAPPGAAGRVGGRERAAEIREALADRREHEADERERAADAREAVADRRERAANRREREADERERAADAREAVADKRERAANRRQDQLEELIGELRGLVSGAHRDALEAIGRSQALLLAPGGRGARAEEGARRADDRRRRGQAAIARAAGYSERQLAHPLGGGHGPAGYARAMRIRLAATAAAFAAAEESTGSLFDQLAAAHPGRAGAYQRRARQARDTAHRARDIARELNG